MTAITPSTPEQKVLQKSKENLRDIPSYNYSIDFTGNETKMKKKGSRRLKEFIPPFMITMWPPLFQECFKKPIGKSFLNTWETNLKKQDFFLLTMALSNIILIMALTG
jgi:hypothetical protein